MLFSARLASLVDHNQRNLSLLRADPLLPHQLHLFTSTASLPSLMSYVIYRLPCFHRIFHHISADFLKGQWRQKSPNAIYFAS